MTWPFSSSTRNIALDSASVITPSCSMDGCFAMVLSLYFYNFINIVERRQDICPLFSYGHSQFIMGRGQFICGPYRPAVGLLPDLPSSDIIIGSIQVTTPSFRLG